MTNPLPKNTSLGIKSTFSGLLFTRQKHRKKSMGFSLLRLNTQTPICSLFTGFPLLFFLLYKLQDFTSTIFPFQSKSAPFPLKGRCLAPRSFAPSFSHLKPTPVSVVQNFFFPKKDLSGLCLRYHARLTHFLEQYKGRLLTLILPHKIQFFI